MKTPVFLNPAPPALPGFATLLVVAALSAGSTLGTLASAAEPPKPARPATEPLLDLIKKKMTPKDLTPDEAERVMQLQPDLVILDVRTAEEFSEGHIRGAVNVDFFDREFATKLKKFEGKPVLVHCASGGRSSQTIGKIKDANFPAIYHLKTGFSGWQGAGKPTTK